MDKHEFNIKVDQIKKMVSKGDFETAMKIADTIDWRRVRNANLLSMISSVYEKNAEYQEAKDILLIAFERAPIGKRLLYKLTQLALKEGDIEEAESYYREFCDLAGDDSRQDILRYLILKAKGAPLEQLIHSLESYTSIELDEKWLYELADLYHQAGKADECVKTCDKIMLMFGLGQYVDKAMELKLQYAPLTKYQMDLVENRDKYEEKLRQVEQNGANAVISREEPISREEEEIAAAARRGQVAAMEAKTTASQAAPAYTDVVSPASVSNYAGGLSQPAVSGYPGAVSHPSAPAYPEAAQPSVNAGYAGYVSEPVQPVNAGYAGYAGEPVQPSVNAGYAGEPVQPPVNAGYAGYAGESVQPSANAGYAGESVKPPVNAGYAGYAGEPVQPSANVAYAGTVNSSSGSAYRRDDEAAKEEEMVSNIAASFAAATVESQGISVTPEERLQVSMKEAEAEASLAEEMSKISKDGYSEEPVREKTRVLQNVKDLKKAGEQAEKTKVLDEIRHIQPVKPVEEQAAAEAEESVRATKTYKTAKPVKTVYYNHFMIESKSPEIGLELAVASLKKVHQIMTCKRPAAKISGEKLNQKGILSSAPKLAGKDLIIENAGDLSDAMLEELDKLLDEDKSQMLVVLVDNPRQIEGIRRISPSLAEKFHVITSVQDAERIFLCGAGLKKSAAAGVSEETPKERKAGTENAVVRQAAQKTNIAPAGQPAMQREAIRAGKTVGQRETVQAGQPVGQRETVQAGRPVGQRETVQAGQSVVQRETSAHQSVPKKDTIPAGQSVSQRQTAPVHQNSVRTNAAPVNQNSPVSGDTRVFSRAETAASSNIVQMRSKTASRPDEQDVMEQGKNSMDGPDDGRIMDIDEFAQYCCHYASQIDCNISGKSMLALYERIEIMEEDGVTLTKTAAEDLIEEAADRAEKPSLGKRIAGLFSSKYDKEGLLILKEEHFI